MITHKSKYRTKDGRADYGFSFEQQSVGNWRVYIDNQHATALFSQACGKIDCCRRLSDSAFLVCDRNDVRRISVTLGWHCESFRSLELRHGCL